ncbi:nose resistant to fluoxetine protein 6-like [Coccinella septempunctata]|uniref:nose resistant to fluoxetine protein 6-like n=1 Tax=Coccinella septempunctata TaxID=41139 RepID=UPI001D0980F1|nr:nose resistant to fluoxetine protein 6-like [Coccinella septempunctata]
MRFSFLGVLICCLGGSVSLEFDVIVDNRTVDLLDYLIPTVYSENERCRNDSLFYRQELSKFTVWATDMFDASSKFPSGLFIGSIYDTGNFDECVRVKLPTEIGFSGQHCMAHFKINPLEPIAVKKYYSLKYDKYENIFNMSTWLKIANYAQDGSKQSRDENYFSFCLPSTCSHTDLQWVLRKKIGEVAEKLPFALDVHVDSRNCQVWRNFNFTTADFCYMGIMLALILLGIGCTIYDINSKQGKTSKFSGTTHEVLKCFSFSNTCEKLTTFKTNEHGFDCMNGMKVLTMFLVIMGHRIMFYISSPLSNPSFVEACYRVFPFILLLNGPIVVDTFFTISGFLGCYLMLLEFDKRQKMIDVGLLYLHRFLRLTPTYAAVLGFYCTIFVQLGEGPFWDERIGVEHDRCMASWWANILYLNNYVNPENLCLFQSWYLTCEIHYFLMLPFLAYFIWKKPKLGITFMVVLIILSVLVPFSIILVEKEEPMLLLYMKFLRDPVNNHTFQTTYIPSHMRASSYLVGIVAGYLKYKIKNSEYKMPKRLVPFGWIFFVLVTISIYITAFMFYIPVEEKDHIFSAIYGSFHHLLWSMIISWFIIAISEGCGSWIEPILAWKPFTFLNRVTYSAFLCHGAIQMYTAAINRGPVHTGLFPIATMTASDITLSYLVGFLLTLVIEGPTMSLEKLIFRSKGSRITKDDGTASQKNGSNGIYKNRDIKNGLQSEKLKNGFTDIYIPRTHLYNR